MHSKESNGFFLVCQVVEQIDKVVVSQVFSIIRVFFIYGFDAV